ncbi:unnamed protein product, partial [Prorocentrum cordatum]
MAAEVADYVIPKTFLQKILLDVLNSMAFTLLVYFVITFNCVFVGMRYHCDVRYILGSRNEEFGKEWWEGWEAWFRWVDRAVVCFFIAEVCLRILAERGDFLRGPNKAWNIFEALIVTGSILDMVDPKRFVGASTFRVFRILRVVRIIKLFSFLSHLRLMLFSMVSCLIPLVWALVLLFLLMYCFAIWLLQSIAQNQNVLGKETLPDQAVEDVLQEYWDGIFLSMRTLIYSVTDVAAPFWTMGPVYGLSYLVFVTSMLLGLLNVMVGVFVQESANVLLLDRELVLDRGVESGQASRQLLAELFLLLDADQNGYLTEEEIMKGLEDDRIKAFFKHIGVDMTTKAHHMFALIDTEREGYISMTQFVDGCLQFQGGARPIDVAALGRQIE